MMALCYDELTREEKLRLDALSLHPGFPILKRLMEDACIKAKDRVVSLDPTTDKFSEKLQALQHEARAMNAFSASLIGSIRMHSETVEMQMREEKEAADSKPRKGLLVQSNKGQ